MSDTTNEPGTDQARADQRSDQTEQITPDVERPKTHRPHTHEPAPAGRRGVDPTLIVSIVAGAIALFALVVGIVTLARTGLPADDITEATTTVGPFARSTLMGVIEVAVGLIAAAIAASRRGSSLTALGLVALVFGLVWLIEPQAFGDALGVNRLTAWTYLLIGAASTGIGMWAPDRTERVVVRRSR